MFHWQKWTSGVRGYFLILFLVVACAIVVKSWFLDAVVIPSLSMEQTLLEGDYLLVNKFIYSARPGSGVAGTAGFEVTPFRTVERGDVIVFRFPGGRETGAVEPGQLFVKRCVAVGGDEFILRGGEVKSLHESSSNDPNVLSAAGGHILVPKRGDTIVLDAAVFPGWKSLIEGEGHTALLGDDGKVLIDGRESKEYSVERNYLFVLGDNRNHSYDSREWGFLPEANVVGKAMVVYWSVKPEGGIRWDRLGTVVR
jgi:signal peptidase I